VERVHAFDKCVSQLGGRLTLRGNKVPHFDEAANNHDYMIIFFIISLANRQKYNIIY
jgi:hypothetical protein